MSSLQPIHALNLDSAQQQTFVKYYHSLPDKPPTTVRIFDRSEFYSVHGADAATAAREVFASAAHVKRMGAAPALLDYLVLSKGNFEVLVRKLLLVRGYRVEVYAPEGARGAEWALRYRGSPGCLTQLEAVLGDGLGASAAHHRAPCLMAVDVRPDELTKTRLVGVALVCGAEYSLRAAQFADDELLSELQAVLVQLAPAECLLPLADGADFRAAGAALQRAGVPVSRLKRSEFSAEGLLQDLNRLLKFGAGARADAAALPETQLPAAMASLAAALRYSSLLSDDTNFGRFTLERVSTSSFVHVDAAAARALDVFPADGAAGARSLFGLLDRCRTPHGKRLLAQWLRQPLRDARLIEERLDAVQLLVDDSALRLQLHDERLRRVPDLQALARRLAGRRAGLLDCYKIYQAVGRLPALLRCLGSADCPALRSSVAEPLQELTDDLDKFQQMVEATLDLDAVDRGEFLVKPSFDERLEALARRLRAVTAGADAEAARAARELGLDGKQVKLEIAPQHGLLLRVTKKEEKALRGGKRYTVVDAVKGGVRFRTDELTELSDDYRRARSDYESEQGKVVEEIVAIAAGYAEAVGRLSATLARLDVLVALAAAAVAGPLPYCRPQLSAAADALQLEQLRHPCLEVADGVSFVPNDVRFDRDSCRLVVVTGANMGGKSTWMRACGAAVLLAHVGSFVPAARARVPVLRAICARVGAADHEQRGQSTFMTEMLEAAAILRTATPDSLVLVDELGRGTSTYEGCAIAWAIAERLATRSGCFCLFATHYHELTRLAELHPRSVANAHAAADAAGGRLLLPHRIRPGPAARSLGLRVARLADLPPAVLQYAEERQAQLEAAAGAGLAGAAADFLRACKRAADGASDAELMRRLRRLREQALTAA